MKLKEKTYVIEDSGEDFYIRIDYRFLGIWHTSEILCHPMLGSPIIFGTYGEAKNRISEICGDNKSIKKRLKLLRNDGKRI